MGSWKCSINNACIILKIFEREFVYELNWTWNDLKRVVVIDWIEFIFSSDYWLQESLISHLIPK